MDSSLFRFIIHRTKYQQIVLILLTILSFPFIYSLLHIPKVIINEAIGGEDFPKKVLNFYFSQIDYLILLSGLFFVVIFSNGFLKFAMNYYQGKTTEFACYTLRQILFQRIMFYRLSEIKHFSSPEIINMTTTQVEPIGGFIAESFALPFRQGGTLVTLLLFVFIQDFYMGLAAVALYPLQVYLVPIFQKRINLLTRERSKALYEFSEKVQETVQGMAEIKSFGLDNYTKKKYDAESLRLFKIKNKFFQQKYLLKLINNIIGNIVPFLFYSIGGYFVIHGNLSLGSLVTIIAAQKDLQDPWVELLDYFQRMQDSKDRYEHLKRKIDHVTTRKETESIPTTEPELDWKDAEIIVKNVHFGYENSKPILEATTFRVYTSQKVAIVAPPGQGKGALAEILAGLQFPLSGEIYIVNHTNLTDPSKLLGKEIHFVSQESYIFAETLKDNLLLSYKETQTEPPTLDEIKNILNVVDFQKDLQNIGLSKVFEKLPEDFKELILKLRISFKEEIESMYSDQIIDFFEKNKFVQNISVFENLVFGLPGPHLDIQQFEDFVIHFLRQEEILNEILELGYHIAQIMLDMFAGLTPGHPLHEEFSLIKSSEIHLYQSILQTFPDITQDQEKEILKLSFKLIPSRHRLIEITKELQEKIIYFRKKIKEEIENNFQDNFYLYEETFYNDIFSIWDNIIFGKIIYGVAAGQSKIDKIVQELLKKADINETLIDLALNYQVGLGGKNLSRTQRQKIAIARALLSPAHLLVFDTPTFILDDHCQQKIIDYVLGPKFKKGIIWTMHEANLVKDFDQILVLKDGRIVEQGQYNDLLHFKGEFVKLVTKYKNAGAGYVA